MAWSRRTGWVGTGEEREGRKGTEKGRLAEEGKEQERGEEKKAHPELLQLGQRLQLLLVTLCNLVMPDIQRGEVDLRAETVRINVSHVLQAKRRVNERGG